MLPDNLFERHVLEPHDDGYAVILYVHRHLTEFASELNGTDEHAEEVREQLENAARSYIRIRLPQVGKVTVVKIMMGTLLIGTLPFAAVTAEAAAPSSATGQTAEASTAITQDVTFNIGYLYSGNTSTFIRNVDRTNGVIKVTSPSYFNLNPDGSLQLTWQVDSRFITEMHNRGITVVPFLSNHWDRELGRQALENRDQLAKQIADAVATYNLDGVNVDIENVTEIDRDNYTDFVRLLRQYLPPEKEVSVAVAANPNAWKTGWHGSYDVGELAKYADYLMLMAYDESWQGSPLPGPVASGTFVEKSIRQLLNNNVPANKIVLGLPFYGRYWVEGEPFGGFGITGAQIQQMLQLYNGTVTYDELTKSAVAHVTIDPGDPTMNLNGGTLSPGTYTIWYENEQSLQAKIDIVKRYGLKGTGEWSLGQENPAIWAHFAEWLQNPVQEEQPKPDWHRISTQGIAVIVDGEELTFDQQPYITGNYRTMVPLRGIFEALGAKVEWDGPNLRVTATRGDRTVEMIVGQSTATVNGQTVHLDAPSVIVGDRTMIPLRFVSEALGAQVFWDGDTQTVLIDSSGQ